MTDSKDTPKFRRAGVLFCLGMIVAALLTIPTTANAASLFLRSSTACPTGKVAVGGGAQVTGEGSGDFKTRLQETAPGTVGASQSTWLVAIRNGDTRPHTVGLYAVCASRPVGYQVVRKDVVVPAGGFLRSTAICPAGKVVLGGGSQVVGQGTADFKISLQESGAGTIGGGAQSLWLTALRNNDSSAHTIGLFAVCATRPAGYQVVNKNVAVPAGGFLRNTATCPAGKVVLAGGSGVIGEGTANFKTVLQESAPGTIGGGAQSLWLTALRNTDIKAHTIGLNAVCATKPAGYQVLSHNVVTG